MYRVLLWILNIFFKFLDWWNGVNVLPEQELICITYRYRFNKYKLYVPFKYASLPYKAKCKGKIVDFDQQPGIPIFVDPEKLGFESIFTVQIDD